jgi:hypothetical protein
MKKILFIGIIILMGRIVSAQSAFVQLMPYEIRQAFQNGTRSISGMPGVNYWQNNSKYKIEAELFPEESLLKGTGQVIYFNNSPDSLNRLVIRLYPNIYKTGNSRQFIVGSDAVTEGMVIGLLKVNGHEVDVSNKQAVSYSSSNMFVKLDQPLVPGDSVRVEIKWQFEISEKRPIRTGNYGRNRFFVAYWYPQIAVYDDIDGWDIVDYLGAVEFYNDFSDFDVTISTPKNFMVWATGTLVNQEDIYVKKVIHQIEKAEGSDEIVKIFSTKDCRDNRVLRNNKKNNWHFQARYVPDFSFAATNQANWEGSSLIVDSTSGRRVFVDAVYADSSKTFENTARWARESVAFMSNDWPGYPFPYVHMTTFNNGRYGGGMETPMMANNGDPANEANAAATVFHEISHTYFPFFMGTNERKYAWMDEGWAANLPIGYMNANFPEHNYFERFVASFEQINGKEREMALMTLSYGLGSYDAYRSHAYVRPALAYHFLRDALGDSIFKKALHKYIDRWNGKHPTPYDFFNTFVDATGQSLLWFFKPWFFDRAVADLAIKKVTMDNKIVVENVGGLPLPVVINCEYEDGTTELISESTAIWSLGEPAVIFQIDPDKKIKLLTLGSEKIPDINKKNNVMSPGYR